VIPLLPWDVFPATTIVGGEDQPQRPHVRKIVYLGVEKTAKGAWKQDMMCIYCFDINPAMNSECPGLPEGFIEPRLD
jgi:hypothetical protein